MESLDLFISGGGGAAASFLANQAVTKWRLSKLEEEQEKQSKEMEKSIQAVNISKSTKFKEIREDYREREQILHARIDRTRDENNKRLDEMNKSITENNDKLDKKIDAGFAAINTRLDAFIQNINK